MYKRQAEETSNASDESIAEEPAAEVEDTSNTSNETTTEKPEE